MLPFNSFSEPARRVSQGQLQALLSIYQQDSLTGIVQLTPVQSTGEFFVLLYVEGKLFRLYQHLSKGYVRHDETHAWNAILPSKDMDLLSHQFSPRFIRPLQVIFEAAKTGDTSKVATQAVIEKIQMLEKKPNPLLAHFHWPSADGFALIPGNGLPSRQLLFWSPNHSSGIPNFTRWPETECTLTTYEVNAASTAWHENCLALGLDYLYEQIFIRYDELVGSSMVSRLEEQLNTVSRMQGWKISFTGHTLNDTHFFSSMSDMRIAYRTLLMSGQRHISSVVGEKLFEESARAGFISLPPVLQTTLTKDNVFTYRIPST